MHDRYRIDDPDRLLSPSFVVFRDLVERNIDQMIAIAGNPARLRPHCKTHKLAEIVRMQLAKGIVRQKCATIAEAEMLARAGCRDVLLAYNPVGPNIGRVARLVEQFPDVRFGVTGDDADTITALGRALHRIDDSVDVVLDVNPGRDRTGVLPGGFHLYDGHQHQSDFGERTAAVQRVWEPVAQLRNRLEKEGIPVPRIVCGGTPTFPVYARMTDRAIELSPGTCVFHDASYGEKFPDLNAFTPAALVLTRVVSRPMANRVTFDCGTKSVASDPPMGQRVVFPDIPDAVQVLHNEEHLVVETADAARWKPGDWTGRSTSSPTAASPTNGPSRPATAC
jgi:D-serine deaminase-like pyridoxal phosphate-dependent protein